ncbi:MAG: 50S ribosomal protein L24 [Candidatus Shikimatogenerans sp. Ttur]|uniref:Large ribosomal subunit protein uL24 n=1 Tax=Candidatus Shikimatogenerans sp. Ttur TaxID=3158569 RepID=A0AAU7ZYP7_9FLAO
MKNKIKKGDYIIVIYGKFKNKIGKVLNFFKKKKKILIKNINYLIKNIKYNYLIKGYRIKKEYSIHISNVCLIKKLNLDNYEKKY